MRRNGIFGVISLAAKGCFAMFLLGSMYVWSFTMKERQSQFKKAEQGGYISSKQVHSGLF